MTLKPKFSWMLVHPQVITLTLTFSKPALIGGLSVKLSSAVLRKTQQRPHEVRQLLCTQTASALFVKHLEKQTRAGELRSL